MSRFIKIEVHQNEVHVEDRLNSFNLLFKIKHLEIIKLALDIAYRYTIDVKLEDLRIIKELNNNYKQKQIQSNWLDPMRAQLIKDKILQELKEPNVNEHETLIGILGHYKIKCDNRNKLRELLFKLDVKELDYLKSKGEKTNEKSSSKN